MQILTVLLYPFLLSSYLCVQSLKLPVLQTTSKDLLHRRGGGISSLQGSKDSPLMSIIARVPNIEYPMEHYSIGKKEYGMIFMDQFCPYHSVYLARRARDVYGISTISCFSSYVAGYLLKESTKDDDIDVLQSIEKSTVPRMDEMDDWKNKLPPGYKIVNIYCESDSGLDECELLSEAFNPMYHNGYNPARRDKYQMNETVRKYGLQTVRQVMCGTKEEALAFAQNELGVTNDDTRGSDRIEPRATTEEEEKENNVDQVDECFINTGKLGRASNVPHSHTSPNKAYCVVKPKRGVASDDVFLCSTLEEVANAFDKIHNSFVFGSTSGESNDAVLVQEFASGTEYALDIVSKNGEHKVAALWRYDKRPANGSSFVYFATECIDATSDVGKEICEYAMKVLDSLGLKHGLTHTEVIVDKKHGPRLVEVNCRQHNTNFAPLTMASIGYNALDMLLAAYLGDLPNLPPETSHMRLDWNDIPRLPRTHAFSAVVHLVCFVEGTLVGINEDIVDEIHNLPSVQYIEIYDHFEVGGRIDKTIDIRSDSGWVHLINDDEEQFQRDYNRIVDLMPELFQVQ